MVVLTRILGPWFFTLIARGIAAFYFLFSPRRVMASVDFYGALFPGRSVLYHLWCTFLQYGNFTSVYLDRMLLTDSSKLTYDSEGWENIESVADAGKGGIILMSHLGNWEVAARLLKQNRSALRLMLYMGVKHKEAIEKIQKDDLARDGIRLVAVAENGGSPFDLIEAVRFLNSGGIVSMTGDLVWKETQDTVEVDFLGRKARLPRAPYILAMLSGAPLLVFFSFRTGGNSYAFSISAPVHIEKKSRADRQHLIDEAARKYAALLENAVREHPFEWYHFEPFLTSRET
jgi:predicted LPLAT superfamily acyltransferase